MIFLSNMTQFNQMTELWISCHAQIVLSPQNQYHTLNESTYYQANFCSKSNATNKTLLVNFQSFFLQFFNHQGEYKSKFCGVLSNNNICQFFGLDPLISISIRRSFIQKKVVNILPPSKVKIRQNICSHVVVKN